MPARALAAGFSNEPIGTHTGKTMMLAELRLLLAAVPRLAPFETYRRAAVHENALAKATAANRANTMKYLKQLYGLRPTLAVFAAMRELWPARPADQPMLALLCALARDVLLRATAPVVLASEPGAHVGAGRLSEAIATTFTNRYSASTLSALGQHSASTWTQAGLLAGARDKHRAVPEVDVAAGVYAFYLGHLEGLAGPALFTSRWTRPLCRSEADLRALAEAGARSGWLEYRSAGGMMEITFHHLDDVTGWEAR